MKVLFLLLTIVSFSINAQSLRDLKSVMEDMGKSFKSIGISLTMGNINSKTISEVEKLISLSKESRAITPDTVLSLPNIEQAKAFEKYQTEIDELTKNAQELSDALKNNDLQTAKTIFAKLGDNKKQGHKDFK